VNARLAVGICSCLESHIKYCYAYAAERFFEHPDLLRELYKDISVDIDTLISTASKRFGLADVVAANIQVSSIEAYRARASHFFTVFFGKAHDFPWDYMRVFNNGDPKLDKDIAQQLDRLGRVFDARHNFIHETDVLGQAQKLSTPDDPLECVDDALWLIAQFDKQFEHIELSPKYAAIKDDEGMQDAIGRNLKQIDDAIERIKDVCDPRQYEKLEAFKKSFVEYLWLGVISKRLCLSHSSPKPR
jgi:hypothetical protein